ncbi:nucleobase:cation symporter-2, NCS2 family [Methylomagnum ishizawai]|uniref:Nucleobase:cation symporter-2, NCS2 family n=1 Tax=Methylomagnum ishizawai TaxID=1760988 RepID=A0A1Y6CZ03_9GAMM|nr:solute carrier family 23 protein [Methylomagnum ishizawai]SMF95909.1 nucleobase:cation symporter-2, NCS2 family [Methylomagnum ishizawai]
MRKPDNIVYWTQDRPPPRLALMLALQQISFLAVYLVVSPLFGRVLDLDHEQSLQLISATLLGSGIGVALQAAKLWGIGSGLFCPVQATSSTFAALLVAKSSGGLGAVFGAVCMVGLFQMAFALLFARMRGVFTVQVAGVAVMLIGLGLGSNGMKLLLETGTDATPGPRDGLLFLLTLGTMILCNVWSSGFLRLVSAFLGLSAGFLGSWFSGAIPMEAWEKFIDAPLFYLPRPMNIGWQLDGGAVLPALLTGLFLALHGFGALVAAQRFNDADWKRPDPELLKQGIYAEGLTNIINSFLNGLPLTSSGGAVGLAAATGCTSRYLAFWLAGIMVGLAFMPKAILFWEILPEPVMGAALIFLASFTIMAGLQVIASRLLDNRKILTVGIALILGFSFDPLKSLFLNLVPESMRSLLFSGVGLGVLGAVLLSAIFRIGDHTCRRLVIDAHQGSLDEVVAFLERQGKSWGARAEVVRRAEYATWQAFEILTEHAVMSGGGDRPALIEMETIFNEYSFAVVLYYHGSLVPLSMHPPSHEDMLDDENDAVLRMAGYMLRRLADGVRVRGMEGHGHGDCELRLIFND